jgi:hypothetical protein
MVSLSHRSYVDLWSRGELAAAEVVDERFVLCDCCAPAAVGFAPAGADGGGLLVGRHALQAAVASLRTQYPDLYVELQASRLAARFRLCRQPSPEPPHRVCAGRGRVCLVATGCT